MRSPALREMVGKQGQNLNLTLFVAGFLSRNSYTVVPAIMKFEILTLCGILTEADLRKLGCGLAARVFKASWAVPSKLNTMAACSPLPRGWGSAPADPSLSQEM